MNKISVAVVDDNEKIVETICNELERDEEINIVGKAKKWRGGFWYNKENQSWCCGLGFDNAKDGRIIINEQDT